MELRQLKSVCLIGQYGSVKEAAKRSFLTSSAVSLQVKELERELDLKIFERKGRKLILTVEGELFYQEAKKIIEAVNEAAEKAKSRSGDWVGKISLAAPACLRSFYLPGFARFRAAYPSIRLAIFARSHSDAMSMIDSGDADLAMGLFQHSTSDLEEIPLVRPKLTAIVPEKNSSILRKNLSLRHLSDHPLVLLQPSTTTRMIIDGVFRKNRLALKSEMEASTCAEIKRSTCSTELASESFITFVWTPRTVPGLEP